ncbi:hypothetical protein [Roseibium sediminis]|nr:hypothetical protein [Roseibium sediminis]
MRCFVFRYPYDKRVVPTGAALHTAVGAAECLIGPDQRCVERFPGAHA